ncbi:MAG: hypothetical protein HY565_04615, partial [Candidatus Kerfeldbacteria bacterium]|nr:hypothetical protein [Candidatus Kerfeldbacteria bacterium]
QQVLQLLPDDVRGVMFRKMSELHRQQAELLKAAEKTLGEQLTVNEQKLALRAAVIGGIAGGLGSFLTHTFADVVANKVADIGEKVLDWFSSGEEALAPAAAEVATAADLVTVPGAEPITEAGKMAFVEQHGDQYMIALHDGQIDVHKILPDGTGTTGNDIQFSRTITVPDWDGDSLQAVETADGVQLLDDEGKLLGELHFNEVTGSGTNATGSITEQLFADPDTSKMLDAMGLQPGEVQYDPNTQLFHIPDDALRDAAGHPEYLGQTAGWRARRMEFILKALSEGKTGESSEMIVARAERATSNLLLKSASHGDPTAAYHEAFGKDAGFIKKNIMPWIDGERSRVSERWMRLVTELKTQPLSAAGGVGGVGGNEVTFSVGSAGDAVLTNAEAAAGDALATAAEPVVPPYLFDADQEFKAAGLGSAATGVVEGLLQATPKPKERPHDLTSVDESSSAEEFNVEDTTKLMGIEEQALAMETKRLTETKGPREEAALREIQAFISTSDTATRPVIGVLETIRTDSGGTLNGTHIDALVANATSISELRQVCGDVRNLLGKEEAGVHYGRLDAANGGRLAAWATKQEAALDTITELQTKFDKMVAGTAAHITDTRQITDSTGKDKGITDTKRRAELLTAAASLALPSRVGELVPGVINDPSWQASLEAKISQAKQEAELAIVMIDLNEFIGTNGDLAKQVHDRFAAEGCFDATDLSLPLPAKAKYVITFLEQIKIKSAGKPKKATLRELKLLSTETPAFDTDEQAELKRVLDNLFMGKADIFAK